MSKIETQDFGARYDGRLIRIELYCNSDEDPEKIARRVRKAARGQKLNAVVGNVACYTGAAAREVWTALAAMAAQAHADPAAKPFDDANDE